MIIIIISIMNLIYVSPTVHVDNHSDANVFVASGPPDGVFNATLASIFIQPFHDGKVAFFSGKLNSVTGTSLAPILMQILHDVKVAVSSGVVHGIGVAPFSSIPRLP